MTIKQQGGIFGRNPTFNEVDATDITTESLSLQKNNPFVRLDDSDTDNNGEFRLDNTSVRIEADKDDAVSGSKIKFKIDNSEIGSFDENGNLDIDGNLVVASGQGIDFSATSGTGTSELFSDYEQGTFTPTITSAGTAPTVAYNSQTGAYTKIGNRVHVDISISTSSYTAGTGNFRIAGLPFTAASGTVEGGAAPMGFKVNTGAEARLKVEGGDTVCQLLSRGTRDTSTGWGNAPSSIWGTANPTIINVSFTYIAA